MDMVALRRESLQAASSLGYPINPNLPVLDDGPVVRDGEEVARRALAIHAAVATSYGFPVEKAVGWMEGQGLLPFQAASEREFMSNPTKADRARFQWKVEGIWALTWSIGIHDGLSFAERCSNDLVKLLPDLQKNDSADQFIAKAKMRSSEAILAQTDLAYCLHWAIRENQRKGGRIPGPVDAPVVIERRHALEWLIDPEDWDHVPMDT